MARWVKLDHDWNSPRLSLKEMVKRAVRARRKLVAMCERRSPSGKGWHRWVLVKPQPRTAMETVALQLLFGSDPLREAYILNRATLVDSKKVRGYWARPDSWNVLYRKPSTEVALCRKSRATFSLSRSDRTTSAGRRR